MDNYTDTDINTPALADQIESDIDEYTEEEYKIINERKFRESTDFLDQAVFLEETLIEKGRIDGRIAGLQKGFKDGEFLGARHGRSLGEEIGFYIGFTHTWLSIIAQKLSITLDPSIKTVSRYSILTTSNTEADTKQQKIITHLIKLGSMVEEYPLLAPEDIRLQDALAAIRAKFRVCAVRLGLITYFNQGNDSIGF